MVSKTLKLKQLISWHTVFEIISEDVVNVVYYPNPNTMIKVQLDKASLDVLKQKKQQITTFLEQEVTLSGNIVERLEKQTKEKTETVEEWVRVA